MRYRSEGLTLVEVMISLAVLAVGIFGLVQLQGASLRYTSRAESMRTVTQIAEAEVEWLRQTEVDVLRTTCDSYVPPGYTCEVDIVPLGFIGYGITVSVENRDANIELQVFTTGQRYITGTEPTGDFTPDPGPPPGPGTGGGEPDPTDPPEDDTPAPCVNPGQGKGQGKGKGGC